MKKLCLIFILILSLLPIFAEDDDEKLKLAVMEFEDLSGKLSKKMLSVATEQIRSKFVASNKFIVIAKERQENAMIKQMKKESYKLCNDKNCQIPLGQALSADTILRTTITFFGGTYTITSELIDLAKEATVKGAEASFNGTEKSMKEALDSIVTQIVAREHKKESLAQTPDARACEYAKNEGTLEIWNKYIESFPNGECSFEAKERINKLKKENFEKYKKAAEKDDAEAQFNLGLCYFKGEGTTQDYSEAVKWYRKAAEQDYAEAQFNLGFCYYNGFGVTKDYSEAFKWTKKAAEQGKDMAQANIGWHYINGLGVTKDSSEAFKWYKKAAEQGNTEAQSNIGIAYSRGDGVPQNYSEAFKWTKIAAEKGNVNAQLNLGSLYVNGFGVTKDSFEAFKWIKKAAEQGNVIAQVKLGICYFQGVGISKNYSEAFKWYKKAAEQGHAVAQFNLGFCYYNGLGVAKNYSEGVKWLKKAAQQGNSKAQEALKEIEKKK